MAEATAEIGFGTAFGIGDGAAGSEAFPALAEVIDITPPSDSVDVIEKTHMASPDRNKEFGPGLNDGGECSFGIHFLPGVGDDARIQSIRTARELGNYRITFPGGATWTFRGFLTSYEPSVPLDDRMTAQVTFKVTGSYVAAAAPVA
jgi:hypothetical protein